MERYIVEVPAKLQFAIMAKSESEAVEQAFDEDVENATITSVDFAHAETI